MDSTPGLGVLRDAGGVWTPPSACYPSPRARPLGSEPPSGLPVPARVPSSGSGAGPFPRRAAARRGHPCPRSRLRLNALSGLRAPKMGSAGAVLASGRRCGAPARPSHPVLAPLLAGEEFLSSHSGPWAGLPHWGPFQHLQPQVPLVSLASAGRSWCLSRTGRRSAGTGPHLAGSAGTPPGPSWLREPGLHPRAPAPAAVLAGAECPSSLGRWAGLGASPVPVGGLPGLALTWQARRGHLRVRPGCASQDFTLALRPRRLFSLVPSAPLPLGPWADPPIT